MADFIEGKRPVIEALRTGVPIKSILMADNVQRDGLIEDILRKAKRAGATVEMVPRKVLDGKSDRGSHQGVMAKAAPFPYVGIGDVIDAAGKSAEQHDGRALVIILDHITDAGNLGAVSRSAEAVGACGIVIPNKRSAHVEASTYKSSAGAIAHVCFLNRVPCAVIRCISDGGNEEAPMSYEEFLPLAAKNSSELTLAYLKSLQNL